jgi:hypothetical protein
MIRLVAGAAFAAESLEVGVLMAEEAGRLPMLALQGNRVLGPGNLLP